jgi:hypothetical protein
MAAVVLARYVGPRLQHHIEDRIERWLGLELNRDKTKILDLTQEINAHLRGWANYFQHGYPCHTFRQVDSFTRERLAREAKRRSQRGYKLPKGRSYYAPLSTLL